MIRETTERSTALVLVSLATLLAVSLLGAGPIPQDPTYHGFADQRALLGVPNGLDVLSNIPFLLIGGLGISLLASHGFSMIGLQVRQRWEWGAWLILFSAVAGVAFGSSYYHLAPDNPRLVWDRLPITVAFTSMFALVLGERLSSRAGRLALLPFIALGLWSAWSWHQSELLGQGDMRFYIFVQAYPLLAIPTLLALRPPMYTHGDAYMVAIGLYALAKICEVLDPQLLELSGFVSGHTLKHLVAATAVGWILRMMARRSIISDSTPPTGSGAQ